MKTVTIAGNKYQLGELAFSDDNVALFESLLALGGASADPSALPLRSFRRALHEALVSGSGQEKADEAMAALKMDFNTGSDLLNAFEALGESLGGK